MLRRNGNSYGCPPLHGMRSAQSGDCVLSPAGGRRYEANHSGIEPGRILGKMCTCEEIARGTHACRASKLGPVERWWTQDGKLGITIQDPTPRVRKTDTFIVFCLFVLHSVTCLKTCTSLLVLRHYEHLFLFSMLILHVTSSWFAYIC